MEIKLKQHENIENRIFNIRGVNVMVDRDLAELYQVKTMVLNQAVKRNIKRFPEDFMFKLNHDELKELITNCDRFKTLKHTPSTPYVFTEQGVAMLSGILNSDRAVEINIQIMRVFVKIRQYTLANSNDIKVRELEKLLMLYIEKNDERVNEVIKVLNNLITNPPKPIEIGFRV
jgi:hypothetical protein